VGIEPLGARLYECPINKTPNSKSFMLLGSPEVIPFLLQQVPISLAIRISSVRGVLRIHLKPPPSDQIWYGFTSMPDLEWELESSIGDRKLTNSHIATLVGNRFKVLNVPFLLSSKHGVSL
jgi:hypothetical protein